MRGWVFVYHSPTCNRPTDHGQAGPCAQGSTVANMYARMTTKKIATNSATSSWRTTVDPAERRRAIEVATTAMAVVPAIAADMKHSVSQVEAAGTASSIRIV